MEPVALEVFKILNVLYKKGLFHNTSCWSFQKKTIMPKPTDGNRMKLIAFNSINLKHMY